MNGRTVILGAGITGLSAGYKLAESGRNITIIEKENYIGGLSYSMKRDGFILDYGPHKLFTQDEKIINEWKEILNSDILTVDKFSKIRLFDKFIDYPFRTLELLLSIGFTEGVKLFFSYLSAIIKKTEEKSYKGWVINRFGKRTYEIVFGPYAEKLWGDPAELHYELAKKRIVIPNIGEVLKRLIVGNRNRPVLSADKFFYPKYGIIQLSENMLDRTLKNGSEISLGSRIERIDVESNRIINISYADAVNARTIKPADVVSTIPLDELLKSIHPSPPEKVMDAVNRLKYRALILVFLKIKQDRAMKDNWIFVPEKKYLFNRISEQKSFSPFTGLSGETVVCVEITTSPDSNIFNIPDEDIFKHTVSDIESMNLFNSDIITGYFVNRLHNAYPVYYLEYKEDLETVLDYTDRISNLVTAGRQGLYAYVGIAHAMDMGFTASGFLMRQDKNSTWKEQRKKFDEYQVVD